MSRQIFGKTPGEGGEGDNLPAAPVERRVPKRPLMGLDNLAAPRGEGQPRSESQPRSENQPRNESQPVGAFGASLSKLNERGRHAEEIEKKLAAGQTVVELDTELIDPSFVSDRMPLSDAALSDLVEAIRESTQLSPILVRPHPDAP